MKKVIQKIDTIIADCEKTIEETWSGDDFMALNRLDQVIKDLKLLRSYSLSKIAKKKAKRIKKLRNGTNKQTQKRLNTADMYDYWSNKKG